MTGESEFRTSLCQHGPHRVQREAGGAEGLPGGLLRKAAAVADAVEEVKLRSRQYAKRQLTWLRRNPDIHWILWEKEPDFPQALQNATEFLTAAGVC